MRHTAGQSTPKSTFRALIVTPHPAAAEDLTVGNLISLSFQSKYTFWALIVARAEQATNAPALPRPGAAAEDPTVGDLGPPTSRLPFLDRNVVQPTRPPPPLRPPTTTTINIQHPNIPTPNTQHPRTTHPPTTNCQLPARRLEHCHFAVHNLTRLDLARRVNQH
ncbi:hypothetical protein K438DRAFT_1756701 [Mycena galopus ATCC 62051]|nr:hypothetical protein K438DRAFT_1756701 [Mycena galopus ATCC 62051]